MTPVAARIPASEPAQPAPSLEPVSALERVIERVRLLARRRLLWVEHLREGSLGQAGLIGARDLKLALENRDSPEAEFAYRRTHPELRELEQALSRLERSQAADDDSPLNRLCETFELTPGERDVLGVCLASALEPMLGKVWAALHSHASHNYPSEALIRGLVGNGRAPLAPRSGSLLRWDLVRIGDASAGDPAPLELDPHILEFLCEHGGADPVLVDCLSLVPAEPPPASWPIAETCARVRKILAEGYGARLVISGPRHSGRRTFSALVSQELGGRTLAIDTTGVDDEAWPRVHLHAQRQALLLGASLLLFGTRIERRAPAGPGLARLQCVVTDSEVGLAALPGVLDLRLEMPRLALAERRELWRALLPVCRAWPEAELTHVVERYQVQIGDIAEIARRGLDRVENVRSACRSLTRDRLGDLGSLVDCPFQREDLLLAPKLDRMLDELLFEARERVRFWERPEARRLFPRGTGLIALMTGTPGTGKTMTAQVIARELELDLFRVDLASSVSKYIGETAKNLRSIFARAREMNAVLLFDEADALFSKRTEVRDSHDRYANADTNYLLQLLEEHDGIALLASNKRANIDTAFVRRIRYILDFPRPSARERLLIWRRLTRELAGPERIEQLNEGLETLAECVDLTGAQIKLSLLSAIFGAQRAGEPLRHAHLVDGIEAELSKESRSLSPKERERVGSHG